MTTSRKLQNAPVGVGHINADAAGLVDDVHSWLHKVRGDDCIYRFVCKR